MKRLIVNADDFGLTRGVNQGIVRGFREGILTSTTLMANGAAFEDAVAQARANPGLGIGCHLVLVGGRAVAAADHVASLADRNGNLPAGLTGLVTKLACGMVRQREIESEFRAQIERVRAAGIEPAHLDTHKHTHSHPKVMEALARVAKEFGITRVRKPFEGLRNVLGIPRSRDNGPSAKQRATAAVARAGAPRFRRIVAKYGLRTPDHFFGLGLTGHLGGPAVLRVLNALPEGTSELMCHPGVYDEDLERSQTRLKRQREVELAALLDPAVRNAAQQRSIELVSYRGLD
jgi:hopanoid biosynthesis associated protein HpnK